MTMYFQVVSGTHLIKSKTPTSKKKHRFFCKLINFNFRHYRYEHKLACLLWKVDMKDVIIPEVHHDGNFQGFKNNLNVSICSLKVC